MGAVIMIDHTINEIIIEKIDKKNVDKSIKEILKELLDLERQHMLLQYPRFSEDYEKIISRWLVRRGNNENQKDNSHKL